MRKYIIIPIATILFFFQSCSDFEKVNTDPNNPVNIDAHLLLTNILFSITTDEASIGQGTYDMFVGGDMGGGWSQQWCKTQYNSEERYIPRNGVIRTFWNTMYYRVLTNSNNMSRLAEKAGNKNIQGIGLVLKAYGFAMLTDVYGDIPFSQALKADSGILLPKYDRQEDVYTGILALLDEAGALIAPGNGDVPASSDIMYAGDVIKWKKFANSLKFRCLMRIVDKKPSVAPQLQALANNANDMFLSNDDEAKYSYLESSPNPIYNTVVGGTRSEYRVGKPMVDLLESLGDPRLPVYAEKTASDSTYKGKVAGYLDPSTVGITNTNTSAIGSFYLKKDLPAFLLSYSELQFLMAEARHKGYITIGTVQQYYESAVKANFAFNGLSSSAATSYLSGLGAFIPALALTQIGNQKYIALYSQGMEAWIEWKRTRIPALTPAIEGRISVIPFRFTYPDNEPSINKANYDAAVAAQGPDLLETKIWWINY